MKAYVDFNGKLREASKFNLTEAAVSSKTWMQAEDGKWYGFSRVPSSTLQKRKKTICKCAHDYVLDAISSSSSISLANSFNLKWKLEFSGEHEKSLWLNGHILKILQPAKCA